MGLRPPAMIKELKILVWMRPRHSDTMAWPRRKWELFHTSRRSGPEYTSEVLHFTHLQIEVTITTRYKIHWFIDYGISLLTLNFKFGLLQCQKLSATSPLCDVNTGLVYWERDMSRWYFGFVFCVYYCKFADGILKLPVRHSSFSGDCAHNVLRPLCLPSFSVQWLSDEQQVSGTQSWAWCTV